MVAVTDCVSFHTKKYSNDNFFRQKLFFFHINNIFSLISGFKLVVNTCERIFFFYIHCAAQIIQIHTPRKVGHSHFTRAAFNSFELFVVVKNYLNNFQFFESVSDSFDNNVEFRTGFVYFFFVLCCRFVIRLSVLFLQFFTLF